MELATAPSTSIAKDRRRKNGIQMITLIASEFTVVLRLDKGKARCPVCLAGCELQVRLSEQLSAAGRPITSCIHSLNIVIGWANTTDTDIDRIRLELSRKQHRQT